MPFADASVLILVVVVGFLFFGALAPFETLGWWAGWYGDDLDVAAEVEHPEPPTVAPDPKPAEKRHFIVFLSGIHSVSSETYSRREIQLLEHLRRRLPGATTVELFPYSVTNRALTGQRIFARVWRWAYRHKLSGAGFAGFLINFRNVWQVAVSADRRYGPIYNQGSASLILRGLKKQGYNLGDSIPITLIGYSGGGQIATGAAPYLRDAMHAPVRVISLGGVMSSDPGLLSLDKLHHFYSQNDRVERLGSIFFPGRWPVLPYSPWNQAKKRGVIELIDMGPPVHSGQGGYLDAESYLPKPDGRSYFELTLDTMVACIAAGSPHIRDDYETGDEPGDEPSREPGDGEEGERVG
ncbi:MAG: hypothetical protein U5L04_13555 [Trueperaceae bacterium]|nr:hypothetical protein [Trueperaceae bacterium]